MLKSMTGYGTAQGKVVSRRFIIESKSVNHKFCEVNLRISQRYAFLEPYIVEFTKASFKRGRIDISIREDTQGVGSAPAKIDFKRLHAYQRQLKRAAKELKINTEPSWDTLLNLPQVLVIEEEENFNRLWRELKKLLKQSFDSLEKMRVKEGKSLHHLFSQQIKELKQEVKKIEKLIPNNIIDHRLKLEQRIRKLSPSFELDPQRLAQEVAYFVDRTDTSEELQRLKHHFTHFQHIVSGAGPLGRKLDFLCQEMNREVNTLSAKAQNAQISQRVVECKHTLEKMREQVQNVE